MSEDTLATFRSLPWETRCFIAEHMGAYAIGTLVPAAVKDKRRIEIQREEFERIVAEVAERQS